ncbi:MAG: lipase family protein [Phormidesmis sp. RL_2_1]|nr:lipase family protein [Phormidesmis sp. RL_2_1]
MRLFIYLISLAAVFTLPGLSQPGSIVLPLASAVAETNTQSMTRADIQANNQPAEQPTYAPPTIEWLSALALVLAGGALLWGGSHYVRQQQWQRIEFLRQAVKEFEQEPDIYNALKILDFEEYRDYAFPTSAQDRERPHDIAQDTHYNKYPQSTTFRVSDELLCRALDTHDQRSQRKKQLESLQMRIEKDPAALAEYQTALWQYRVETVLRDWFNKMLNGLEHFGYFIESGLFTAKELQPWLNYWIKLIGDPAYRRPGASSFYDALYSYIHHSGFFGVQKLFERFGYRILPSPYKGNDLVDIEPIPTGYSTRLALTLAKSSYLAYQDKQFVAEVIGRWGAALHNPEIRRQLAQPNQNTESMTQKKLEPWSEQAKNDMIRHNFCYFDKADRDTQAYMFRTDQFMVLAFRGSQEPKDWLTNFTTRLRNFTIRKDGVTAISSYRKGRVHTGFFLAWAIIEEPVLAEIQRWTKELAQAGKLLPPLYITGHSLGGALATIAAAALIDNGIRVEGVYTFGQPRVGDRTFITQLNANTGGKVFRFVNNNDIVPHVPPPFSIWNPMRLYGHVGTVKYFDAKGKIMAKYKLTARLTDATVGLVKGIFGAGFNLISDHRMEYYISHLDDALQEETKDYAAQMLEVGSKQPVEQ